MKSLRKKHPKPIPIGKLPLRIKKLTFSVATRVTCIDGPAKGEAIFLRTKSTLPFRLHGEVGFYELGTWKSIAL